MKFLNYQPEYQDACVSIFDSNVPRYFAPQEKDKFVAFLNRPNKSFYVVMSVADEILACGGFIINDDKTIVWLRWGMVQHSLHQRGLGRYLALGRMALLCREECLESIRVGTTQYTCAFHEKLGFRIYETSQNGIAPGFDEYRLMLKLNEEEKSAIRSEWQKYSGSFTI